MRSDEMHGIATALGRTAIGSSVLAGGYSHETSLLTLSDGRVVVRLGGPDPHIEAAVMAAGRRHVPVPHVLTILPEGARSRPAMVLEYVEGIPLHQVLADTADVHQLGAQIGRIAAAISTATFERPGFFADTDLNVTPQPSWSEQLPAAVEAWLPAIPDTRLDPATRSAWAHLCTVHAPALDGIEHQARLVHADFNPKNILVAHTSGGWRVAAVLDWEFGFSGCPYADAANMMRFADDYPPGFLDRFRAAYADHLSPMADWAYLGRVLDMFALSDMVTRPLGHPIADQAAQVIRRWVAEGVPDAP
jgi:Ser/Thr protein kinase RdoA (MazF antagonist)